MSVFLTGAAVCLRSMDLEWNDVTAIPVIRRVGYLSGATRALGQTAAK